MFAKAPSEPGQDDGEGDGGEECASIDTAQAQQVGIPTIALQAIGPAANADCPPTGQVTLLRYQAVDDYGRLINPMLTTGQVQGGHKQSGLGRDLARAHARRKARRRD